MEGELEMNRNRNSVCTQALILVLAVLLAAPAWVFAQGDQTNKKFTSAQIDQMLAGIALYPDSLLAQILIAATYPDQVADADHWVKDHPDLKGDALNAQLDKIDWDLSIKALVPFPQVLAMMDEHMNWTTQLGQAFLAQQTEVMDHVQEMRSKAYAAGNLKSTEQQKVVVNKESNGEDIAIEPADPDVVYVPYYDPSAVYGGWWWPGYDPYAWYPFGGPIITAGLFGFGIGIGVSPFWNWGWGFWNWGGGWGGGYGGNSVFVNVNRTVNINNSTINGLTPGTLQTANLTAAAATGTADPVRNAARAAGTTHTGLPASVAARTGANSAATRAARATGRTAGAVGRTGRAGGTAGVAGRTAGAVGRTGRTAATGTRPSAVSIEHQLSQGRTGSTRGASGSRTAGNLARGGTSMTTGNVSRGATARDRDVAAGGARSSASAARGGTALKSSAPRGGVSHSRVSGGGFRGGVSHSTVGGGGFRGGSFAHSAVGGGGFHGGGGGFHGGGGGGHPAAGGGGHPAGRR